MSFCPPPQQKFKALYKFCNILIPGRAVPNKKFVGRAGNFSQVDTSSTHDVQCAISPLP